MKLFTDKDVALLTDLIKTPIKWMLITTIFILVTLVPSLVFFITVSFVINEPYIQFVSLILIFWIITMFITIVTVLSKER